MSEKASPKYVLHFLNLPKSIITTLDIFCNPFYSKHKHFFIKNTSFNIILTNDWFCLVMITGSGVNIGPLPSDSPAMETRIEDGKLLYERRW